MSGIAAGVGVMFVTVVLAVLVVPVMLTLTFKWADALERWLDG